MDNGRITRERALAGLPARRARTLLFLIERRTVHTAAQSRQAMGLFPTEEAGKECDLASLETFRRDHEPPVRLTTQDLEQHAPQ